MKLLDTRSWLCEQERLFPPPQKLTLPWKSQLSLNKWNFTDGKVDILDLLMLQNIEKESDKLKKVEPGLPVFRESIDNLNLGFVNFENDLFKRVFAEVLMAGLILKLDDFLDHDWCPYLGITKSGPFN